MREITKLAEGQCLTDFSASYKVDRHTPHPKVLEADKEETGCVHVHFVYMQESVCVCLNSWPETLLYVLNG